MNILKEICNKHDVEIVKIGDLSRQYKCIGLTQAYNEKQHAKAFRQNITRIVDKLVILDDGSTDGTGGEFMGDDVLIHLRRKSNSDFDDQANRSLLLEVAGLVSVKWLFFLDLDERVDPRYERSFKSLLKSRTIEHVRFRYVHAWDSGEKFRLDYPFSDGGVQYRLKMIRKKGNMRLLDNKKLHFELAPYQSNRVFKSHVLIIHLGNVSEKDRRKRYNNYKKLDPEHKFQRSYEHLITENVELKELKQLYKKDRKTYLKNYREYLIKYFNDVFRNQKANV